MGSGVQDDDWIGEPASGIYDEDETDDEDEDMSDERLSDDDFDDDEDMWDAVREAEDSQDVAHACDPGEQPINNIHKQSYHQRPADEPSSAS